MRRTLLTVLLSAFLLGLASCGSTASSPSPIPQGSSTWDSMRWDVDVWG